MSIQIGEASFLNFYQNAGIKANEAVHAFELIKASGKFLQAKVYLEYLKNGNKTYIQ